MMSRTTKGVILIVGGIVLLVVGVLALINYWPSADNNHSSGVDDPNANPSLFQIERASGDAVSVTGANMLRIRLSQGEPGLASLDSAPLATGEPLTEAAIQQILQRLPPLSTSDLDVVPFRLPEESLPPPQPGMTLVTAFPPTETGEPAPALPTDPLQVVRFAPEGDVPLAPFVSLTFNQPMIPLGTLTQLAAGDVPAQLTPPLPGSWEWIGTRTLRFTYQGMGVDRLPMATEYSVTVPAGVTAASGATLADPVTWHFRTPTPQVTIFYPEGDPLPLQPLFFLAFDQLIDPPAALSAIRLEAAGRAVALRLATPAEVAADAALVTLTEQHLAGRWLIFLPDLPLPADTPITVTIGPGLPSAEGPLVSQETISYTRRTYAPLRVVEHDCGWDETCPPGAPFSIRFNNPLDQDAFDEASLTLEPDLPEAVVSLYGDTLTIRGASSGRVTYTVRLAADLQDLFGQTLGREERLTFRVGPAEPALSGPDRPLITLDPSAPRPALSVFTINYDQLRVRLYAVTPADWPAYLDYRQTYNQLFDTPTPPGRLVQDAVLRLAEDEDLWIETDIDLTPALTRGTGHVIVVVEPPVGLLDRKQYRPMVQTWVQAASLGLDAYVDHSQMVAWASDLRDGAPLAGVSLTAPDGTQLATTDSRGLARWDIPAAGLSYLLAQQGDTTILLPPSDYVWDESGWHPYPVGDSVHWLVLDDRHLYQPGEEVHLKGWVRQVGGGPHGDVALLADGVSVRYRVSDPQGNELAGGEAMLTSLGGFDFAFTLPTGANLGYGQVELILQGGRLAEASYYHTFQIQAFRRPEFEVVTRPETVGPYLVDQGAVVAVSANYYAGGPLPNADVTWRVTSTPGHYTPPNWPDFIFGRWTPWWLEGGVGGRDEAFIFPPFETQGLEETLAGVTDALGNHYLQLNFEPTAAELESPQPISVRAEATVMDVNRQAWSAATNLLVHPSQHYVGLRSTPTFVTQGTPLEVQTIVVDVDGNPVAGRPITMRAAQLTWRYRAGQWVEEEAGVQLCETLSQLEPVACTFETLMGGEYRITASVIDEAGRGNESQFTRWVSGGQRPSTRRVEEESVVLIPNQERYNPGEVAELLVQAPFSPAEGLLILARGGLVTTERFRLEGETHILRLPIEEAYLPNLVVQVELVGAAPRLDDAGELLPELPARAAYASGQISLSIATHSRALTVALTPAAAQLAPGEATTLDILVTDAAGRPAADAEMVVMVVDEAILALTSYDLTDPLSIFYFPRSADISRYRSRSGLVLANPQELAANEAAQVASLPTQVARATNGIVAEEMELAMAPDTGADANAGASPIDVRSDFNPLALFAPAVRTDAQGRAQVVIQLPDNLTRYRIMAVAVAGDRQFGAAESNLTTRLPLMVRPSAPRFLRFGDQFELPVVIQNQTDAPLTVDVALEAANLILENGAQTAGRRLTVPAQDRVEVRFPATALRAGTARFQVAATAGAYVDAAVVELPVYTPATTEAFAVYGVLDTGALAQTLLAPQNVWPQFGELTIGTSSTALQALTDAVLYLVNYPFDCSEQIASRILALSALRPVLSAFAAEGLPDPATLEAAVQQDIERLERLQNGDGGFACWRVGDDSIPFYTVHAAHALQRAHSEGFVVSPSGLSAAHAYLASIDEHYPDWYSQETRWAITAYAMWVRQLMGDADPTAAAALLADAGLEQLSLEAVAWLWPILDASPAHHSQSEAIQRHLHNQVVETAGAANFVTGYGESAYLLLHSDRRTDALILEALIAVTPESDLIPKLVNGLLAHRVQGRWNNTQENVFILLALDRYFQTFEAQTPDFVAGIWLGDTYAGRHVYEGRTTERYATNIPMAYLLEEATGDATELILSKEGVGRLYYRLGLRYAPTDLTLEPLDRGFVVTRSYEAVDDPGDVTQDDNGVWHIRAGARVRVRLTLVADSRRYHVALVDPLPAGLEPIQPALAVSGDLPQDPARPEQPFWWWQWPWYEHHNLRDDRAEAFAALLWDGIYDYTYVARATTPGTFVIPPATAEEMYAPDVFGRSASAVLVVEDR